MTTNTIYANLQCEFCTEKLSKLNEYKVHMNTCNKNPKNKDNKYSCDPCKKSFSAGSAYAKHVKTCPHNKEKESHACSHCNKTFDSKGGKTYHEKRCLSIQEKNKYTIIKDSKNNFDGFLDNKYTKLYFQIINSTTEVELLGYCEVHHIIPRSFGGSDDKDNLVKLSSRKHFLCHYLLTKMVKKRSNLWFKAIKAFSMMNMGHNGKRYLNSRLYEQNRKHMSETMSESQSGEKNSAYGKRWIWIHHVETNENKRHDKNKAIPENYSTGQVRKNLMKESKYTLKCYNCDTIINTHKENKKYCSRDCLKEHKSNNMKNLYLEIKDQVIKLSNLNYGMYKIAKIINRDDVNHMTIHKVKKLIEKGSL